MTNIENNRVKCPFCAEPILKDAIICKHCKLRVLDANGKRLTPNDNLDTNGNKPVKEVSLGSAMFQNLMCPGLGSWKLGAKKRGAIIFIAITIALFFYMQDVIDMINPLMSQALNGNMHAMDKLADAPSAGSNWGTLITLVYAYSFVDAYLVYSDKQKNKKR